MKRLVGEFIAVVREAVERQDFALLVLGGPRPVKPVSTKPASKNEASGPKTRGRKQGAHSEPAAPVVQATTTHAMTNTVQKVSIRPIETPSGRRYQWTERIGSQEKHETLSPRQVAPRVAEVFPQHLLDAHLYTSEFDLTARQQPTGDVKLKRKPPTQGQAQPAGHNRTRDYLLPAGTAVPFLVEVGIQTIAGEVRPTMYHKFRQINRYLEFVRDVLPTWPADRTLRIVDFGCGKSYLTFALHYYLTQTLGRTVELLGLDLKQDVVEHCAELASTLNCAGLRFEVGSIAQMKFPGPIDLAISLHACDTATDESLAAAIARQAEVILAVPCCQHELNRDWPTDVLPGITGYGLLRDRFAALATDALRARFLDACGYETQVLEFVELEHTAKNVLLRAVRKPGRSNETAITSYTTLRDSLQIGDWALEQAARRRGVSVRAS